MAKATSWAMALPIEKPTTWALRTHSAQQSGGGVGHRGRRERLLGQRRAPRSRVVEGGESVTLREPVELWLPRFGGVAEPSDEQDVGPLPSALGPDLGAASVDWFAQLQPPGSLPQKERSTSAVNSSVPLHECCLLVANVGDIYFPTNQTS